MVVDRGSNRRRVGALANAGQRSDGFIRNNLVGNRRFYLGRSGEPGSLGSRQQGFPSGRTAVVAGRCVFDPLDLAGRQKQ